MQRYFVKGNVSETTHSLVFSKRPESIQLKKVMRVRAGENNSEVVDDSSQLAIVEVWVEPICSG